MNMDLSMYSKDNKKVLKEVATKKKEPKALKAVEQRVGRPALEDEMARLTEKVTINLNSYERDFLVKLQKETGVPLSTYLRRKLLEVNAFGK